MVGESLLSVDCPPVKASSRFNRFSVTLTVALSLLLVAAPAAPAEDGVGLIGPTTDKTITFFCFGVIAFFAILVTAMSLIQDRLEKRKERRRYDLERFG